MENDKFTQLKELLIELASEEIFLNQSILENSIEFAKTGKGRMQIEISRRRLNYVRNQIDQCQSIIYKK